MTVKELDIVELRELCLRYNIYTIDFKFINMIREMCRRKNIIIDMTEKDFETYAYNNPDKIKYDNYTVTWIKKNK